MHIRSAHDTTWHVTVTEWLHFVLSARVLPFGLASPRKVGRRPVNRGTVKVNGVPCLTATGAEMDVLSEPSQVPHDPDGMTVQFMSLLSTAVSSVVPSSPLHHDHE